MKVFFSKTNVFNVVFFIAFLAMALFKSTESISRISALLSVIMLIMAVLKSIITPIESIINSYSGKLIDYVYSTFEKESEYFDEYKVFEWSKELKFNDVLDVFSNYLFPDRQIEINIYDALLTFNKRRVLRIVRKVLLFIYYSVFLCMLIVLLLMEEIPDAIISVFHYDFTIWSLIVILFQLFLSEVITNFFIEISDVSNSNKLDEIINKKYGDSDLGLGLWLK